MFGEMEFWFAMIKIVAIVALIVVGLVMVLMHFKSPNRRRSIVRTPVE
ncbi:D-serine/D-alanine/glycine transporter [Kluyvera cryocrescens]|uniref:D-serine/D-alanine/glycine transporter n=1 Tax=Kluyvera cryocrescens TaxID=580 RepID=A0A485B909_KLUCR|nr:D-serine/D-alanine/glycine transporter [Kluyvera cryocrescens]